MTTHVVCLGCGAVIAREDQAAHASEAHPEVRATNALWVRLSDRDAKARLAKSHPSFARKAAGAVGEAALFLGIGAAKRIKWLEPRAEVGPWERGVPAEGETRDEYLRKKAGIPEPFDPSGHQYYVKDDDGNLRPYEP